MNTTENSFLVSCITEAEENSLIYEPFGIANDDDNALVRSIRQEGIKEPLVITSDWVLLSGHRRLAAAKYLRKKYVPVQVVDTVFDELSSSERVALLRLYNQQREKTVGENIREAMLSIDKDEAYETLLRHRATGLNRTDNNNSNVEMGKVKKRARITTLQFLAAVKKVVADNEEYLPLTDRRVHYLLLNDPPLKHDKKPNSRYANDKQSYKALTNLLIRARLTGDVAIEAIEDMTRPIQLGGGCDTYQSFVKDEVEDFLMRYSRNLMQGQADHIEIMLEKNALRSIIEKVARDYCIPVTTGRGFSSLSPRYDMAVRFKQSGKARLVLLMLTDFDPDGEMIAASFARSMRDDFEIEPYAVKVALTSEDVEENNLPSDLDAKPSSPNYKRFVSKYGVKAVELDAAPVTMLQAKLREAIEQVIDIDEYNGQIELEKKDASHIAAYRKTVIKAIGDGNMKGGK